MNLAFLRSTQTQTVQFLMFRNLYVLLNILLLIACGEKKESTAKKETDFCATLALNQFGGLSKELADVSPLMAQKTGVYVLEDGGGAMIARAWLTQNAERTIDVQYFIFSTDNVGLIAIDYLVRAADRGVKVRLLVDDLMVDADLTDIATLDSHDNIEIKVYNPGVNLGKNIMGTAKKFLTDFRAANLRMHNKTFIVDGQVVITGGRTIADEYFDYDHEYNFRDRDVLLLGKETSKVNASFNQFWDSPLSVPITSLVDPTDRNAPNEKKFEKLHQYACDPNNFWPQIRSKIENLTQVFPQIKASGNLIWVDEVTFVSDEPGKNDGNSGLGGGGKSTVALIRLLKNAKTSVDIQSPYLVTTNLGRDLFRDAVKRGVKVRMLTNSLASTDNLEAFAGYQSDRKALLETGVRIFEFRPDAAERKKIMTGELQAAINYAPIFGLHAKTMVVDGHTTVIGTFNLDPRSANLNTECITIINNGLVAKNVLKGMEEEFKPENSWETTLDDNPDEKAGTFKRVNTFTRKILPKDIL